MTAPRKRRRQKDGFSQLAFWIHTSVKVQLDAAVALEDRSQREIIEAALLRYFSEPSAAKATAA